MLSIRQVTVTPVAIPPTGFGADARNIYQGGPVYANVYLQVFTDEPSVTGRSIIFTNGRGLKEQCEVTRQLAERLLVGSDLDVEKLHTGDYFGKFVQALMSDSDYAWLGGVGMSRMAAGAVINALWDLMAKHLKLPAWEALLTLSPEQLTALIDFEPIADALSPAEAIEILERAQDGLDQRRHKIHSKGILAYNTAGWSGIDINELNRQVEGLIHSGWRQVKVKVGAEFVRQRQQALEAGSQLSRQELDTLASNSADIDAERLLSVYATIDRVDQRLTKMTLAADSNQVFDPRSATIFIRKLARRLHSVDPRYQLQWFEEPTNQHSAMGHIHIKHALQLAFTDVEPTLRAPLATGEQGAAPVVFKDLLFANLGRFDHEKTSAIEVIQPDYSRVAGIADNLAILLLAQKARDEGRDVRICPHAGGVGLCEGVRHVQAIKEALFGPDSPSGLADVLEYVDEPTRSVHRGVFAHPALIENSHYQMDTAPGVGVDYTESALAEYRLPDGSQWQGSAKWRALQQQIYP